MRCSTCGTESMTGRKFCAACGNPLFSRCPKCGAENSQGSAFCEDCGTSLAGNTTPGATHSPQTGAAASKIRITPEQPGASLAIEGERKTVTALFADIKGSTELEQDLDPEEARAIVDPALKLMIEAVRRYDGYIVQSTGDGIFALFGAPVAHEDHPQRTLYAALRMQEELRRYGSKLQAEGRAPIEIRVGINTGEVVVRSITTGATQVEYTPIGHTTNLASRLQSIARTGSIVASEQTRKFCEGYFTLKPLGPTRVKGVTEPVNVYEVAGLGPLRTRLQRAEGRGLTKFVGRRAEIEAMERAAELAKAGHGQIVAAMAEPGVGKSRLFYEFKAIAQSSWMVLEAFSASHGKASAYLPVVALLHSYFEISSEDDARKRRERVARKIAALDHALENALPYLYGLLGIVEEPDPLARMDTQIRSRRTLDAIKRLLLRESLNQPLMLLFEDLHWIDEETQALLNLLADSIGTARVLLLANYRPEYSHRWGSKTYYTQLRLDPLGKGSAEDMLSSLLGDNKDLIPLKRLIIKITEGNPFFMEETVQVLLDDGALVRNGTVRLTKSLNELKIPPSVQAMLASRIDRLPPDEKELLQTLAVIGREFAVGLLRCVVTKSEDELSRMLHHLQLSEFIYEQPAAGEIEYTFKHALTQEVAHNSVLVERRRALHARIGAAIEEVYADRLEDHLRELAHHYRLSGNVDKAIEYLHRAGAQAQARHAFKEAEDAYGNALAILNTLPESPEREARELQIIGGLRGVLAFTKGFSAPSTMEVNRRARTLAQKTGDFAELFSTMAFAQAAANGLGDHRAAADLADQMLDLARRLGNPTDLGMAHEAQIMTGYQRGDLIGVEEHFAHGSEFFHATGLPPAVATVAFAFAGWNAWAMGHASTARERIRQSVAAAEENRDPFDLAFAPSIASWLQMLLREPENAEAAATRGIALCEEQGFPLVAGFARVMSGWARAQLGRASEGVALIHEGMAGLSQIGARAGLTLFLTLLAEAQALDGATSDALDNLEKALHVNPEELVWRPEALRLRGVLRLVQGQTELAEADLREAIAFAQKMSAKAWELRATTSLARLLATQGKRDEAREMLADIYNWFTDGFDTADLKDAKALLEELKG